MLAFGDERAVALAEAHLGTPGNGLDGLWKTFLTLLYGDRLSRLR